jgi:hypothetical protein
MMAIALPENLSWNRMKAEALKSAVFVERDDKR